MTVIWSGPLMRVCLVARSVVFSLKSFLPLQISLDLDVNHLFDVLYQQSSVVQIKVDLLEVTSLTPLYVRLLL